MSESDVFVTNMLEIDMPPFAKARPRVTRRGTYMPGKYVASRTELRVLYFIQAGQDQVKIEGAITLIVSFVFKMAKSWSKKKRAEMEGKPCLKKPDLDNLVGAVMDAILDDDSTVAFIMASKIWGPEDKIFIKIRPISNEECK